MLVLPAEGPAHVEVLLSSLIRRTAAIAVAAIAALVVSSAPAQADTDGPGRLNAADMTLLIGLRQAGLWEIPAAQMAAQKGTTPTIRQAGQKIAAEQTQLDQLTVDAARKLGATLPPAPTAQQQGLLNQLQAARGSQFDQLFVTSLRDAYGFLYPIIGEVRSATRSAAIRQLADQANVSVMHYMQTLESTGLVQYPKLAPAAIPPAQDLSAMGMARPTPAFPRRSPRWCSGCWQSERPPSRRSPPDESAAAGGRLPTRAPRPGKPRKVEPRRCRSGPDTGASLKERTGARGSGRRPRSATPRRYPADRRAGWRPPLAVAPEPPGTRRPAPLTHPRRARPPDVPRKC
jgi:predicted outer membrane protein